MNAFNTTQTLHHRVAAAFAFARCPFDPARLTAALSTDVTRLPPDKSLALISPDATLLDAPITADLMKAAGLSKP